MGAALLPLKPALKPPHPGSADPPTAISQYVPALPGVPLAKLRRASSKLGRTKPFASLLRMKNCLKAPETPLQQAAAGRGDGTGARRQGRAHPWVA